MRCYSHLSEYGCSSIGFYLACNSVGLGIKSLFASSCRMRPLKYSPAVRSPLSVLVRT